MNNCHIMFNLFQASPLKIKQTNNAHIFISDMKQEIFAVFVTVFTFHKSETMYLDTALLQ